MVGRSRVSSEQDLDRVRPCWMPRATQFRRMGFGMTWENRIVGYGESAPDDLLANPDNWRVHPKNQQDAMAGALDQIGWVAPVIVNQRTGFVVDGHLRVAMAISEGADMVPVAYVDLSAEEEAVVLATFDPLTAMAVTDEQLLSSLMEGITFDTAALSAAVDAVLQIEPIDPLESAEPAQVSEMDKNALMWGYATFGKTKVACSANEVDLMQGLYDAYKHRNDGVDTGFVRWIAEGQPDD